MNLEGIVLEERDHLIVHRQKASVVSLSKKLYPYCLVLVGSRNGIERDVKIELK